MHFSQVARTVTFALSIAAVFGCVTDYGVTAYVEEKPSIYAETLAALGAAEYAPANWLASPNFYGGNRTPGDGKVKVIVVHTTQGSYSGTLSWFQNPKAQVSAHYVVSKNGDIMQMVHEKDVGWHVGSENGYTIGIEHEGFVDDATWVKAPMLDASALLSCYLVKKWGLAADKAHIKGHVELPNQTHVDPGKYWPWDSYLAKIQACINPGPPPIAGCCGLKQPVNGQTIIDDQGNDCIQKFGPADAWWNDTKSGYGGSLTFTYTSAKSYAENYARWRLTFEKAGKYKVEAWIPADGASAKPTYQIKHAGQISNVVVDQKPLSNVWVDLGTYDFAANCDEYVQVGDNTGQAYDKNISLGVDAVRVSSLALPCPDCNDNNPCTDDVCDNGNCKHTANSGGCDDGNPCTDGDKCAGGKCTSGGLKNCDDANPCTSDSCSGGCQHANSGGGCDDGDACTDGDKCSGGKCAGIAKICTDGDACTEGDHCSAGACIAGVAKACDDANPCTTDSCAAGSCKQAPAGGACNDGNACTTGETCSDGQCRGGQMLSCDDANPCTADSCANGICKNAAIEGGCDDGDGCSTGDYCAGGNCLSGAPMNCDDGFPCTTDSCVKGVCKYAGPVVAPPTCEGQRSVQINPCGGAPKITDCPSNAPCFDGICGGKSDVASGDGNVVDQGALLSDGSSKTGSAKGGGGGAPASGCAAGRTADSLVFFAFLALVIGLRRGRQGAC